MIEKLERYITGGKNMVAISRPPEPQDMMDKINELVDAVNGILDYAPLEMAMKAEKDPYAEQRKWIGKLCWYKLCEGDTWKVGRLEKIQENADAGYPFVFDGLCYKICEPVKPDDDIIFKDK